MASSISFSLIFISFFISSSCEAALNDHKFFDVKDYGAIPDGTTDNILAFQMTWNNSCAYPGIATFSVPEEIFFLVPIIFKGPCHGVRSPKLEIKGTLRAPTNLGAFRYPTWILFERLSGLVVSGNGTGVLDAQGEASWRRGCKSKDHCKLNPYAIRLNKISHGAFNNIALLNSKAYHINVFRSNNIRIHNISITAPGDSPNTDGIHVSDSTNINITSSRISVGDDCVSIGPGNKNILIADVYCGPGHGISLGSLGKYKDEKELIGVKVRNCTINGTTNGVRIKTWRGSEPSKASDVTFEDILMINASNPIIIDQLYCPGGDCDLDPPSLVNLSDIHFKNIRGTANTKTAVTLRCSSVVPCTGVELVDINIVNTNGDGAAVSTCSNVRGIYSGVQNPKPCF